MQVEDLEVYEPAVAEEALPEPEAPTAAKGDTQQLQDVKSKQQMTIPANFPSSTPVSN